MSANCRATAEKLRRRYAHAAGGGDGEEHGAMTDTAWIVSCCGGEQSKIVFADTRGKAQQRGGCAFCDFTSRTARRAPEFDAGVPSKRALVVEHGWWFECAGCYEHVGEDGFAEGGEAVEVAGEVYCSARCAGKAPATKGDGNG